MITFQSVLRSYSRTVDTGHSDTDLTPRQRRLLAVLLNLASNAYLTTVIYPPTDQTRAETRTALAAIVSSARPLVTAYASAAYDAPDFDLALSRALEVITNA